MENFIDTKGVTKIFRKKIHARNILKNFFRPEYSSFTALKNVTFNVREGEVFGLLGPNGAGKTTMIKILTGLLWPTKGEVLIEGKTVKESAEKIGLMLGSSMIYHRMTGYRNLRYYAKLYGVRDYDSRIKELAELLGLSDWLHNYVEYYSLGMKSKLALARVLVHDPDILFLDEPTIGLDPDISLTIRHKIKSMRKTMLITTHYMDEAADLCNRIAIINKGKIIKIDTPENLRKSVQHNVLVQLELKHYDLKLLTKLKKLPYVHHVHPVEAEIRVLLEHRENINDLLWALKGYEILNINEEKPSLTHAFIKIVKEKA